MVKHVFMEIFNYIFYRSFTGNFIPQFYFYNIIPWPAIFFSAIGIYFVFKNKKWLLYQLVLGIIFWIFYSFSSLRIIIGYERVVFFTSIIVVLISAFGLEEIKKVIFLSLRGRSEATDVAIQSYRLPRRPYKIFDLLAPRNDSSEIVSFWLAMTLQIIVILLFVLAIPFYTQNQNWEKLILKNPIIKANSIPMPPANNYLTQEDLELFKNIKQKRFLSAPWKGTVIGTATNNYPVITKGGTITMSSDNPDLYNQFLNFECEKKGRIAKEKNIDYIYSRAFSCQNFQEINKSSEGFVLYKVSK